MIERKSITVCREMRTRERGGTILAAALIVFAIVSMTLFAVMQGLVSHQRRLNAGFYAVQADCLADAGLARAKAQLRKNSAYHGETWAVPAEELNGIDAAVVTIEVKQPSGNEKTFTIHSQADFPADTTLRAQKSRDAEFTLSQGEP
jgi:type II secretory pathway component PulK